MKRSWVVSIAWVCVCCAFVTQGTAMNEPYTESDIKSATGHIVSANFRGRYTDDITLNTSMGQLTILGFLTSDVVNKLQALPPDTPVSVQYVEVNSWLIIPLDVNNELLEIEVKDIGLVYRNNRVNDEGFFSFFKKTYWLSLAVLSFCLIYLVVIGLFDRRGGSPS